MLLAAAILPRPAGAIPPPPPAADSGFALPDDQCPVPPAGTVRAYAQPVHGVTLAAPTVLRLLADRPDPALLIDIEHADGTVDGRVVASGVGLGGGDVRIALPAAGRYRRRVVMIGDAARTGRQIAYRISVSQAMESGAPPCANKVRD